METVENKRVVYEFGKFLLDPDKKVLLSDGRPVHLPSKEFETLLLLVQNNGRALSKDEMMAALWHDTFVEESNLAKQISKLRKIFNKNGDRFIQTLPKHGYRFFADIRYAPSDDNSIIAEKRTIRRATFTVENEIEPVQPARLSEKRSSRALTVGVALLIAMIGLGYLAWHYRDAVFFSSEGIDPYGPVRLTDNPNDDTGPQWTNDGRIRFTRVYPGNRYETWIMNADGTDQSAVPMPEGRRIFSWSPDERKVLFVKPDDPAKTYLANSDGSGELLLHFRSGNWSPDSKMITYWAKVSGDDYDIFVYSIETGETRNITDNDAFDADPSFSPDGTRIAFVSTRDGNGEIYTINSDGSDLRRLTFNPTADSHPAFSPDGTQILFTSDRENENADVYLMNSDGSNPVKVTDWDKTNETAGPGGWSRDGTKIAFFSDRDAKDDIYVVSAEVVRPKLVFADPGRDIRTFSHSPDGKRVIYSGEMADKSGELRVLDMGTRETNLVRKTDLPAISVDWSPAGNLIAFHDRIQGNSEVCVMRSDGSDFRILTNDPAPDTGPSWSPDGKRIAFMSYRGEPRGTGQLYLMNADGSAPQPVTPRKGWEGDPAWWPDGSRFVFVCDRNDAPGMGLDICEIGVDGSGERRILFNRDHDSHPVVSPDGDRIAFASSMGGNTEIYLVNSDGSGLLRLTRDPADDQWPEWAPDGKQLRFLSNRSGKFALYEISL